MKFFLVFILVIFFDFSVFSQIVNIENRRIYDDTAGWSGSLDANASLMQNATRLYNLGFRPRVQYKNRKNYFLFISDLSYTASIKEVFANSGMGHFRYARRIKNSPWKIEAYTQVQYNELLNQKFRGLAGAGIRWKMIDTAKVKVFIGTSAFYEYEELQSEKTIHQDWRWSSYLSWFMSFKHGINFNGTFYVQPLFTDLNDLRLSGQSSLSFAVSKKLDINFNLNIFRDSRPPINVLPLVFSTSAGFRIKLGE